MKLTFLGAAREVTGSCFLLTVGTSNVLVDCGMEQGPDIYENCALPVSANSIDAVFLTHAHIDHSGKIPLLYKRGFRGRIILPSVTAELATIMLLDSAHIQEQEGEWRNKKARRNGTPLYEPMYTIEDARGAIELFEKHDYNVRSKVNDGLEVRFVDAGHLLGSSSIEIWATKDGITKKLVFSGDIGNINQPILKNPTYIKEADYVITESTYGDRTHTDTGDYAGELGEIIKRTLSRGGNLVIPSFAVGRTQEMLYLIRQLKQNGVLDELGDFPVYIDSPLAIEATKIFNRNVLFCCDDETALLIKQGINPLSFNGLRTSVTTADSIAINNDSTPKIIISASGMCEAGRIRHHLKHNLWKQKNTVLFVGYQAVGTLGRKIQEGADYVTLFGENVQVKAEICFLHGISGHADKQGLLNWAAAYSPKPSKFFVVHGEDNVAESYAAELQAALALDAIAPYNGAEWDLGQNKELKAGSHQKIIKARGENAYMTPTYQQLLSSFNYLESIVKENRGGSNFDLRNFGKDIEALAEKYRRK